MRGRRRAAGGGQGPSAVKVVTDPGERLGVQRGGELHFKRD